jgi:hypothetical protein
MKTMKLTLTFIFTAIITWSGYSAERADTIRFTNVKASHSDPAGLNQADTAGADSTGYELVVLDPGYETFLASQPFREYYSESYYKLWNRQYVTEWNIRYTTQTGTGLYETYIDYDPEINYGLELEYRLYYYFRFFEKENRVLLVPRVR